MGTVGTPVDCPQCNCVAEHEFNTRTYEDWLFCPFCGYRAWTRLVMDVAKMEAREKGDRKLYPKLTKDGKWQHRYYERKAFGVLALQNPESKVIGLAPMKEVPSEDMIERFKAALDRGEIGKDSYMTVWDGKELKIPFGSIELWTMDALESGEVSMES